MPAPSSFERSVRATELRVRQTPDPGVLAKVELIGPDGASQVLWEGADPRR